MDWVVEDKVLHPLRPGGTAGKNGRGGGGGGGAENGGQAPGAMVDLDVLF